MQEAIQATLAAIERRARLYRRTVMAVVGIALASPAAALMLRSWRPLAGWILLVPVVGGFFVADGRVVRTWMVVVCQLCTAGKLDVWGYAHLIASHPLLPKPTVQGMLAALTDGKSPQEEPATQMIQQAIGRARRQQWRILAGTVALTLVLGTGVAWALHPSVGWAAATAAEFGIWVAAMKLR